MVGEIGGHGVRVGTFLIPQKYKKHAPLAGVAVSKTTSSPISDGIVKNEWPSISYKNEVLPTVLPVVGDEAKKVSGMMDVDVRMTDDAYVVVFASPGFTDNKIAMRAEAAAKALVAYADARA